MYKDMYQRFVRFWRRLADGPPACEACDSPGRYRPLWEYATGRYVCESCAALKAYHHYMPVPYAEVADRGERR
jgi:hypothetical protein